MGKRRLKSEALERDEFHDSSNMVEREEKLLLLLLLLLSELIGSGSSSMSNIFCRFAIEVVNPEEVVADDVDANGSASVAAADTNDNEGCIGGEKLNGLGALDCALPS